MQRKIGTHRIAKELAKLVEQKGKMFDTVELTNPNRLPLGLKKKYPEIAHILSHHINNRHLADSQKFLDDVLSLAERYLRKSGTNNHALASMIPRLRHVRKIVPKNGLEYIFHVLGRDNFKRSIGLARETKKYCETTPEITKQFPLGHKNKIKQLCAICSGYIGYGELLNEALEEMEERALKGLPLKAA